MLEKMVIQTSKQVDQTRVDDGVEDYNYEKAADKDQRESKRNVKLIDITIKSLDRDRSRLPGTHS